MAAVVKQLKIKTNSLKRVHKELTYYEAQHTKDQARLEQMKAAAAEAHDIKQAVRVWLLPAAYLAMEDVLKMQVLLEVAA